MNEENNELKKRLEWFANWHGAETEESILTTYLTGVFKTYTKNAKKILKNAIKLKYVSIKNDVVTIHTN